MVSNKVLALSLAILISCFSSATSRKCYVCEGENTPPLCNATETCSTGNTQCVSEVEKDENDKVTYKRGCGLPLACTTKEAFCKAQKLLNRLKDCSYSCCDDDLCNSNFPALGSGFKVTSGLFVFAVTTCFSLFVI